MSVLLVILFLFLSLLKPVSVFAVCPVCTIAVGAGLGLSRYLGVDDTISGLWVGGFILSSGLWLSSWLSTKNVNLPGRTILSIILMYLFVIPPLYWSGIIGHNPHKNTGMDKLLLGIICGSILFLISIGLDKYLRIRNGGKVVFYYQKVILPLSLLLAASIIFSIIIR
jgi:hypothetical protein